MAQKKKEMSQPKDYKLIVEKDVKIPMRDGSMLFADVLRPDGGDERFPAIMNLGPYQKDKVWIPPDDLEEDANEYMNWETANPLWWCPRGYALVRVDTRGTGKSPGKSEPSSYQEGLDSYDVTEWIARQPWCSGNVGTLGISYHAAFQWRLANLQPPSLKAIMPWEGRADQYRDQAYHGGIFAMGFISQWANSTTAHNLLGRPRSYNPDAFNNNILWEYMRKDLDSEEWRKNSAQWDRITVPVYSVGNWGGFAMHLRGNTEAFMRAASKNKKLRIHTGSHFHPFHAEEARLDQLRWFDHWLKGMDTGIMDEPPVKLEIRTGGETKPYAFRFENEWPIARTQWTKLYLRIDRDTPNKTETAEGALVPKVAGTEKKVSYTAGPGHYRPVSGRSGVSFETPPMEADTEVTGPLVLNLWVSSSSEDMDIYATIRNIGPDGKDVCEVGQRGEPVACVTKGWLRASHRKLDKDLSLSYRPYHAHDERWWLKPSEAVECQVEIWPTSMVFKKGHKLRLDVTPRDGAASGHFTHYNADYNAGATNTIYSGGDKLSWLMLPVIPAK
ncbi:MAG: Xaa-Pro dipeptidyl-peptidase peptidase family [Betaproteobacteria bacterium]|nr:Xaa-Pro dipeptidyl-peptidase peptidase family [Betaproteobacteria bacterium]